MSDADGFQTNEQAIMDTQGLTELMQAARYDPDRYEDTLTAVLHKGAAIEAEDAHGRTAIFYYLATSNVTPATLTLLLDAGANINHQAKDGRTPLMWHLTSPYVTLHSIALLLTAGADVSLQDTAGKTALSWAAQTGHYSFLVTVLMRAGADPAQRSKEGKTAADYLHENLFLKHLSFPEDFTQVTSPEGIVTADAQPIPAELPGVGYVPSTAHSLEFIRGYLTGTFQAINRMDRWALHWYRFVTVPYQESVPMSIARFLPHADYADAPENVLDRHIIEAIVQEDGMLPPLRPMSITAHLPVVLRPFLTGSTTDQQFQLDLSSELSAIMSGFLHRNTYQLWHFARPQRLLVSNMLHYRYWRYEGGGDYFVPIVISKSQMIYFLLLAIFLD
jgi:hypothetical protein